MKAKELIIGIIIGSVVASITGVIADSLTADKITYSPNDKSWGVTNVEAAINSLQLSKTSDNYSTSEKVVGTWTDNKTLYQRTMTATLPSNSNWTELITLGTDCNIKNVIGAFAFYGTFEEPIPFSGEISYLINVGSNLSSRKNGSVAFKALSSDWYGKQVIMTLQYTK